MSLGVPRKIPNNMPLRSLCYKLSSPQKFVETREARCPGSNAMRRSGSKVKPMRNWCKSLRCNLFFVGPRWLVSCFFRHRCCEGVSCGVS